MGVENMADDITKWDEIIGAGDPVAVHEQQAMTEREKLERAEKTLSSELRRQIRKDELDAL